MSHINVYKLFNEGQLKLIAEANAKERDKVGILRAGNTGMLTSDGRVIGPCMGSTYLRYKGIDVKGLEDDGDSGGAPGRELMFEGGRTNEDSWYNVLTQTWPGKILRETEIPTRWENVNGIAVTGRPDIVLCDADSKPQLAIELKQVSSFYTAYEVYVKGMPKYPHLLQIAHYAWQLNVPAQLWYTSRTDFHSQYMVRNHMPAPGTPKASRIVYNYSQLKADGKKSKISKLEYEALPPTQRSAEVIKISPFIQGYEVELRNGRLYYAEVRPDNITLKFNETDILIDDIKRYYDVVSELTHVPPEPYVLKADGKPANYKASDYCSLGKACCKYTEGMEINEWTAKVVQKIADK
jgi:hypothetical protein